MTTAKPLPRNHVLSKSVGASYCAEQRGVYLSVMPHVPEQSLQTTASRRRAASSGTWPRLEADPSVCGGEARVVNTRISVWLLELSRRQGATEKQLLADYPGLEVDDLRAAWDYTRQNPAEIEAEIAEHEAE